MLEAQKSGAYAKWSEAYLKGQFRLLGVRQPQRETVFKKWYQQECLKVWSKEALRDLVAALWREEYRDFKYIAVLLLKKRGKELGLEDLRWLQGLVMQEAWWDSVDSLVPIIGAVVLQSGQRAALDAWIVHENIWVRRCAILHQLHYKGATDEKRLLEYALKCAHEKEFFIKKAIGWAMRMYARVNPAFVQQVMHNPPFSALSVKEALKHVREKENS